MSQNTRIFVALLVIALLVGAVLGIDALRRANSTRTEEGITLAPGNIPIYVEEKLVAGFGPEDLDQLEEASFVDAEEGKEQKGWMLRDVLLFYVVPETLKNDTRVTVSSSSRSKSVDLTWAEVASPENMVMFDLSGRGTLKLVSVLERLDVRDEWVQDVDKIEIRSP